jgi:hypothetical protein
MPMHPDPRLLFSCGNDHIADEIALLRRPRRHLAECAPPLRKCRPFTDPTVGVAGVPPHLMIVVCTLKNVNTRRAETRQLARHIRDGGRAN